MSSALDQALAVREQVAALGCDIYEPLLEHPGVVYTAAQLEALLGHALLGHVFKGANKTRASHAKKAVAEALGYPRPASLRKTRPRFPGQDLDVFAQQSRNLQVWNEAVTPTRRYAVIGLERSGRVSAIRVIEGTDLATLDRTGRLTSKYQARRRASRNGSALVSSTDTPPFIEHLKPREQVAAASLRRQRPSDKPRAGRVLTVGALHDRLLALVGCRLDYEPSERQRGDRLHRAVCDALGLGGFADTGRFPDIVCQALEVKLQLASTIDLGLVNPDSTDPAVTISPDLRHCDARYAIAYATRDGDTMQIDAVVTTTGVDFFGEFQRFGGLVQNSKLQIRLPRDFFEPE